MRGTSRALPIVVSPNPNRSHERMRGSSDVPDRLRPVNLGQRPAQPRSHRPSDPRSMSMGAAGGAIQPIEEPGWDFEFGVAVYRVRGASRRGRAPWGPLSPFTLRKYGALDSDLFWVRRPSIASEMSEEWVEIVPAQRRSTGEAAYRSWLGLHRLTHAEVADDLQQEIGRMVGGGDFVQYSIRASRLAELGLTPEANASTD